jgi:hypothetical protein
MPRGGYRPGSGRRPGILNRRTIEEARRMGPIGDRAIAVLVEAMEGRGVPWSTRVQAASLLADRAFGRSPQALGLELTRRLSDLSLDELRMLEARLVGEQRLTIDVARAPQRI